MNFWDFMLRKEDLICYIVDSILEFVNIFNFKQKRFLSAMKKEESKNIGKDIFIILNGPSLTTQDLSVLKGKDILFVNRGFKHELYKSLQPKYHVFIDPKMLSGEWDIKWIDYIKEIVPEITFIMPVEWAFVDKFKPYVTGNYSIHWIKSYKKCNFIGVGGAAFEFAIQQHYKNIYFTGFDANGLPFEMVNASSHFYGVNEENLTKTTKDYARDLYMFSRHYRDLNRYADKCNKKGIKIINLTNGGLLDMFERVTLDKINN